jgi:hypothetical protein
MKCGYKGEIGRAKHSNRNSNLAEEQERTRLKDARWKTTKICV